MKVIRIIVLCFLSSLTIYSQENEINYVVDFITTQEGLSHNYATNILSDDLNVKWIGTENGITKYNGYDFEYIKPSEKYKELLNENIEVLFKDNESNIWIGTKSGGLSYLDVKTNRIKNFNYIIDLVKERGLRITAISQDKDGNIWVGTWSNGLYVIDFKNEKLIKHYNYKETIYSIIKDFKDTMWFCHANKLHSYNPSNKKLKYYIINGQITNILSDVSRNKIWVTSAKNNTKIYFFNYYTESIEELETGISSNFSKKMSLDKHNRLWIGTWGKGVYRSNKNLSMFNKIDLVSGESGMISGNYNTILSIHHDKNNVTWLTTASGGVVKLQEGNGFKNAEGLIKNKELKGFLNCTSLYKNEEKIFVGTLFLGVWHGTSFSNLSQIKEIGNEKVNAIYENDQKLYIGTSNRFYIYNLKSERIVFSSKKLGKVTSFLVNDNNIYIGTQQGGIAIFPLEDIQKRKSYVVYSENAEDALKIESNRITTIVEDKNNNIWVGTYNGLHLYDKKEKQFIPQSKILAEKLPSVIINSIAIKDNTIWLGTPSGLIKLNYKNNKLTLEETITKNDGLNSDFICAITFDSISNLWFTTHTEIVKYNDTNKSITNYGNINGVKSTSFNNRSFYNYNNEFISFGGFDNITFFNPSNVEDFNTIPEIIFTSLRVNNELIEYSPSTTILDRNFNYADKIKLTHKDNFFSARFIANDYLGQLNIKYRYLLEGYQNQWINLQNRNEINFAGLSSGNYVLKVQGSRDNQNWSNTKSIAIRLLSSPWKSSWAIFIYLSLFLSIVLYLIRSNNYKLKLKNKLAIARIDKEKEEELTEAKLNFFTNISHEFRTPLTLIISPLKELLDNESISRKMYKNLSYIDKNTSRLLSLINQLLDFRKADHGLLKLNVSQGNFVHFANEVHLYFKESTKSKNVSYKFKSAKEEIRFPFDRNKMEIVLCNLVSNAIKYTKSGDKITLKIDSDKEFCTISIKDSGIGMNTENIEKIFDRFFQIKSANTARMIGSGIGLSFTKKIIELHHGTIEVKSELNIGTEFIVKLAMDASLYEGSINENFISSDNIIGYNTKDISIPSESFNINSKEHSLLIIDDNLEILSYLKDILSEDYNVLQAENGDLGFEKASTEIPDLIISDVMMPGKDGITLCKELKSQITTSHIPIILLTARTATVFEIEGLKTGADDYITKPFNSKVIKARISSLLENREKLRAHLVNKVRFEPTTVEIEEDADKENTFIHKAILLVENNLDNPVFGIENMVDELYMSQSTLYRKIKSLTGLSLTAFIRSIRLKKAAHIILTTDLNLNQVSYEVGFNDYKYFKISFKKQFNCLPSKYKELIQNKA